MANRISYKTYLIQTFLGFPTFFYESIYWCGKVDSFDTLYEMLRCVSRFYDTPLKSSFNLVDIHILEDFYSFGLYAEHKGQKSLLEYLMENGIHLKNYK